jgi:hypothetical protein
MEIKKAPSVSGSTGSFAKKMMITNTQFSTPATLVKRNRITILGLYTEEKLARKMTKSHHILQRPPGLTIDAEAYNQHLADKDDWTIIFEIDDGRRFWVTVPEFNLHKRWISRGQGDQYVIQFKYLHRDDDTSAAILSSGTGNPAQPDKPKYLQLSLFGGVA